MSLKMAEVVPPADMNQNALAPLAGRLFNSISTEEEEALKEITG